MTLLSPLLFAAVWACLPNSECPELGETKAWIQEAKQHRQQGRYATAETLLRRAITASAEGGRAMIEALNQLAGVLFLKADYVDAEATVRRALDLSAQQPQRDD